jgi:peptide/nickel transport system permease protein/oligopeptide transport system permease protein
MATATDITSVAAPDAPTAIEGRSLGQIAWRWLRRDRVATAGAVIVCFLVLVAVFAPQIVSVLGDPPNQPNYALVDTANGTLAPLGAWGGMSTDHLMGVEPVNGRDIFSRVVYGSRISLLIAVFATLLSVLIGATLGVVAGFAGGWVDAAISRAMDIFLAFPLLVFAIALAGILPDKAFGLTGDTMRVVMLIFIIGFFNWPYIGRIVRGQTLSLREREFVDAARERLIALYGQEALSFLGVGIQPPTATWGGMLSDAVNFYTLPMFMLWPGMAIFVTVLAFNLFGDGLRDALDHRAR